MFRLFVFIFVIIFNFTAFSQFNTIKWYFGERAGLDFSEDKPKILLDGKINSREGVSSICDEYGNLLFYSDGRTVWNKEHKIMLNGSDLFGSLSSTNAAYAIPHPHNDNQFYLFVTDEAEKKLNNGLSYNIIDMTEDKGKGSVIEKNITLNAPNTEKIICIPKPNQPAYWLITHDWGNSDFLVYTIDPYGIKLSHKINSNILNDNDLENHSLGVGYIKYNKATNKLALAFYGRGFYIFNFDEKNGMLSNKHEVSDSLSFGTYGLEFSKEGRFLYATTFDTLNKVSYLYQYDIDKIAASDIKSSRFLLTLFSYSAGGIQMAPDGKIYVSTDTRNISVIQYPDSNRFDCGFKLDEIELEEFQKAVWGFPRAVPQLQTNKYRIISNSPICKGEELTIEANIIEGIEYNWSGPNGFSSNFRKIIVDHSSENDFGIYRCEFLLNNIVVFKDSIEVKTIEENFLIDDKNLILGEICRGYKLYRYVEIKNDSEFPISIENIFLQNSDENFDLIKSDLKFPIYLEPYDKTAVRLYFESEIPGDYRNQLIVDYINECGANIKSFDITATVLDANITIERNQLNVIQICTNDSIFKNIELINDSNNDIDITEMYFKDGSSFSISSHFNFIESNETKNIEVFFRNEVVGEYKDTLVVIYDLTCERGIREFELNAEVYPLDININIPDQYYEQGSDTCFYVTYDKNCNLKTDHQMQFELFYNEHVFKMNFLENAELIKERRAGDYVYQTIRISNFGEDYKNDTLFKICGTALLTDNTNTKFDILNIRQDSFYNYHIDAGFIETEEICFQQVMRIIMNLQTEIYINTYHDNVHITIAGEAQGEYELNIINTYSASVFNKKWFANNKFEYFYEVNSLSSGVYIALLKTPSGFTIRKKFIVID